MPSFFVAILKKMLDIMKGRPVLSAFRMACAFVMCMPVFFSGPALLALGFSSGGPIAGSVAAAFQSTFGTTTAFSLLQSAAMSGWGASAVAGSIQAGAGLSLVMSALLKRRGK